MKEIKVEGLTYTKWSINIEFKDWTTPSNYSKEVTNFLKQNIKGPFKPITRQRVNGWIKQGFIKTIYIKELDLRLVKKSENFMGVILREELKKLKARQ